MNRDVSGRLPARARRPSLEALESRRVPASYTAANAAELIAAINAANLSREADTITLVTGRTFTLGAADNLTDGPTGTPVVLPGEDLTIVGNGDILERSTAAGTPAFRLLDVAAGGSLQLHNLTIQGGLALGSYNSSATPAWSRGGAVYNRGTLVLDGVIVRNNRAEGHAGREGWGATAGGPASGGGVYSEGALSLSGTTVSGNVAIGGKGSLSLAGGGASGGGLSVAAGTASIAGTTVSANTAQGGVGGNGSDGCGCDGGDGAPQPTPGGDGGDGFGGGIYTSGGSVTVHTSSISDNLAAGGAGGAGGKRRPNGQAGQGLGGGIYIDVATAHLDSYTVDHLKRNRASTKGSNIYGSYRLDP